MSYSSQSPVETSLDEVHTSHEIVDVPEENIETLLKTIYLWRLDDLSKKNNDELAKLKEGLQDVSFLEKLLRQIRAETNEEGELNPSEELQELLEQAREMGIVFKESEGSFSKSERDVLVRNVESFNQDITVKNETLFKRVERLITESYETLKFARKGMETLHDIALRIIRNWAGK